MTDWRAYIGADFNICHGEPCFIVGNKLTRVMVYLVLEMLESGESIQDILSSYPQLTPNHIKAALCYAAEVIKTGETVPFASIS